MTDFYIENGPFVIFITPLSAEALQWMTDNLQQEKKRLHCDAWQLKERIPIEPAKIDDIITEIIESNVSIEYGINKTFLTEGFAGITNNEIVSELMERGFLTNIGASFIILDNSDLPIKELNRELFEYYSNYEMIIMLVDRGLIDPDKVTLLFCSKSGLVIELLRRKAITPDEAQRFLLYGEFPEPEDLDGEEWKNNL